MPTGEPEPDIEPDVVHLRDVQYRDSSNLAKRAGLHVAYRTAPQLAFDWLSAMVPWPAAGDVLDVGCGAGYLWDHAAAVVPDGIRLTLIDLSAGMVDEAVARATGTGRFARVSGHVADARSLPFADASFDLAVSTYALYHVPGPAHAVREMARVMRDDGVFVLMTNGPDHLREIEDVRVRVFGDAGRYEANRSFTPAMAAAVLVDVFDEVAWQRYDDTLHVTDADDLLAFMTSSGSAMQATDDDVAQLRTIVTDEMRANDGVFRVSKHTGAFIARRPRRG
ncbi:MAG: class I SAM-dependent methyltransferase [Acidimicrobiales bacterium]